MLNPNVGGAVRGHTPDVEYIPYASPISSPSAGVPSAGSAAAGLAAAGAAGLAADGLAAGASVAEPIPCVRLYCERMLVDRGAGRRSKNEEIAVPVIELSFIYEGVRVRATDERERLFVSSSDGGLVSVARDYAKERRARCLLEGCGATEIELVENYEPGFDSHADYLVQVDGNVHGYCSFGAYAVPQLRQHGFQVEIADDYPYHVLGGDSPWYADLSPDDSIGPTSGRSGSTESSDWFNLELGVEIQGERIDLLDILLDLLDNAPSSGSLNGVFSCARAVAIPVGKRGYLTVAKKKLSLILDVLRELYGGLPGPSAAFRREQAPSIVRLGEALTEDQTSFAFSGATWLPEQGKKLMQAQAPRKAEPTKGLCATLRPYQMEGLAWLQGLAAMNMNGILADDMGLGKTLQTIAHLMCEKDEGRLKHPALIVAPTSLVGNWQREVAKFAPSLRVLVLHGKRRHQEFEQISRHDVVITTYPLLIRDIAKFDKVRFHIVILDEAQAIKNAKSKAHRAVSELESQHRLCLSGTPVENNLGELWALFDFLMPGFLGTSERFKTQFRTPIERGEERGKLDSLRTRVAPFILRRMKDRVAHDLPPKTELVRPVELLDSQRDLYESIRVAAHAKVRTAIRTKGLSGSTVTILDALMKLRQVCCDPRLVRVESARKVKHSAKYELLLKMLTQQLGQGRRALVFSQFTSMLALIEEGLLAQGIRPLLLTGSTRDRQALVDAFENYRSNVFLISLKAGGTGLNLVSADTVIHYDPWWNPAAQSQATDRAYRIGQKRPVFVYNLIVSGSVEERMLQLQQKKQLLANTILGQEPSSGFQLSEDEVEDLFSPLPTEA